MACIVQLSSRATLPRSVPIGYITAQELFERVYRHRYGRRWGATLLTGADWNESILLVDVRHENATRIEITAIIVDLFDRDLDSPIVEEGRDGRLRRLAISGHEALRRSPLLALTGTIPLDYSEDGRRNITPLFPVECVVRVQAELDRPYLEYCGRADHDQLPNSRVSTHGAIGQRKKNKSVLSVEIRENVQNSWREYLKTHTRPPNRDIVLAWIKALDANLKSKDKLAQDFINQQPDRAEAGRPPTSKIRRK